MNDDDLSQLAAEAAATATELEALAFRGARGPAGEKGRDGTDGMDGRDAVLVPGEATFERDHYKLTTKVVVRSPDTDEVLLTITPHRNGKEPMTSATISVG